MIYTYGHIYPPRTCTSCKVTKAQDYFKSIADDCCEACTESELTGEGLLRSLVAERTALVNRLIEGEKVQPQIEYLSRRIDRVCSQERDFVTA